MEVFPSPLGSFISAYFCPFRGGLRSSSRDGACFLLGGLMSGESCRFLLGGLMSGESCLFRMTSFSTPLCPFRGGLRSLS